MNLEQASTKLTMLDDAVFLLWTWLRNLEKDFVTHYNSKHEIKNVYNTKIKDKAKSPQNFGTVMKELVALFISSHTIIKKENC